MKCDPYNTKPCVFRFALHRSTVFNILICYSILFICLYFYYIYLFILDIYGYNTAGKVPFLKITVLLPRFLPASKRLLDKPQKFGRFGELTFPVFETDVDFEIK